MLLHCQKCDKRYPSFMEVFFEIITQFFVTMPATGAITMEETMHLLFAYPALTHE